MNEEEQRSLEKPNKFKLNVEIVKNLEGKCPIRLEADKATLERKVVIQEGIEFGEAIKNLCGTSEFELAAEVLDNGIKSVIVGTDVNKHNICYQALSEGGPNDITETRLILQANSLYSHGMKCLERTEACEKIKGSEFFMKNAIKLLRLHNETIETLSRYRRGGEQKVIVQHVNVNQGGQAVVGGVFEGGGDATRK